MTKQKQAKSNPQATPSVAAVKPLFRIYLSGPMTGYPSYNFPAFDAAEAALLEKGLEVVSPARLDRDLGFNPDHDVMDAAGLAVACRDVGEVAKADVVVVLPGWEKSPGAQAEVAVAKWLGRPVWRYPDLAILWSKNYPNGDEDVLEEALRLTSGERQSAYGPPEQDFARTALMWQAILGVAVAPKQVALCMAALKISRATWSDKRDNWTDLAGYARCGYLCMLAEQRASAGNVKAAG